METCACQYITQDKTGKINVGETIYLFNTNKENNANNNKKIKIISKFYFIHFKADNECISSAFKPREKVRKLSPKLYICIMRKYCFCGMLIYLLV
jgi:hypothetical protein